MMNGSIQVGALKVTVVPSISRHQGYTVAGNRTLETVACGNKAAVESQPKRVGDQMQSQAYCSVG